MGIQKIKIVKYKNLISVLMLVYTFFVLYLPALPKVSTNEVISSISVVGVFFFYVTKRNLRIQLTSLVRFTMIMIMALVYMSFVVLLNGKSNTILYTYFQAIISMINIIFWYNCVKYRGLDAEKLLIRAGVLQSVLCVAAVTIPAVKNFFVQYMINMEKGIDVQKIEYFYQLGRINGFANSTHFFWAIGVTHGMIALLLLHRFVVDNEWKYLLMCGIVILPAVFNARIGLVAFLGTAIIYLVLVDVGKKLIFIGRGLRAFGLVTASIIIFVLYVLTSSNDAIMRFARFLYDFYAVYSGDNNYYVSQLFPTARDWEISLINMIFGIGEISAGSGDMGYVHIFLAGGFVLSIIIYLGFLWSVIKATKRASRIDRTYIYAGIMYFYICNVKAYVWNVSAIGIFLVICEILCGEEFGYEKSDEIRI